MAGDAMFRHTILPLLSVGLLALTARAGSNSRSAPEAGDAVRSYFRSGNVERAEQILRAELGRNGRDASLLCLLGDILFRRADFKGAAAAYRSALESDLKSARACWGLGRVEQVQFRRRNARDLIRKAFSLDPRDPDIVQSHASFAEDPQTRVVLLNSLIALTRDSDVARAENALAELEVEQRLGSRPMSRLASPYHRYVLKLAPFRPALGDPYGLTVMAKINGARPLRLVLDTGAKGILVGGVAVRDLQLENLTRSLVRGASSQGGSRARVALADSVSFGDLELQNCVVEVSEKAVISGADGVIGLSTFERFNIHLDPRSRILELLPFSSEPPAEHPSQPWIAHDRSPEPPSGHTAELYGVRHLILVPLRTTGGRDGLFLVDTGAAFTVISEEAPSRPSIQSPPILLSGPCGSVVYGHRAPAAHFDVAGQSVMDSSPVALDLRKMSQQEGVQISGILGYSALSHSNFTINYRDGLLQLGRR